jgi:ribulose-phosphate 3-epimerase
MGADFGHLAADVADLNTSGADLIHVDVMDGQFVPNITFGALIVQHLRGMTELPLDIHMMVREPEHHLKAMADAGADIISVHAEATVHLQRTLHEIRSLGKKAGVALNPSTPPAVLEYVLADIDVILIMTVNPGYLGQSFLPGVVQKISDVRRMVQESGLNIRVQVDGGVNQSTIASVVRAGADNIVAGAAVFGSSDRGAAIRRLREAAAAA